MGLTTRLSYEGWDPSAPGPTGPARLSLLVSRAEFNKIDIGRLFNLVHYDKQKKSELVCFLAIFLGSAIVTLF